MDFALVLLLALLIGLTLGAVGGGGSILAVPVLVGVAGLSVTDATTASLIVVGSASAIGLVAALRSGRVELGTGVAFGLAGVGGAAVGTMLNRGLDEGVLLLSFAALMAFVGAKMLHGLVATRPAAAVTGGERGALSLSRDPLGSGTGDTDPGVAGSGACVPTATGSLGGPGAQDPTGDRPGSRRLDAATVARILGAGTVVGFLTGLFGVGGGFVIVPALMFLLGLEIRSATATSLLVIALNSAVALVMRADFGSVDWAVVAPFTALAVVGVLFGRGVADRVPARALTAALTVLVVAMAAWTAVQGIGALR